MSSDHEPMAAGRAFLKDTIRRTMDVTKTDQHRGLPPPPAQKAAAPGARRVALVAPRDLRSISRLSLREALRSRESRRAFGQAPLSLEELSFLLWATQGVRRAHGDVATFRTVPSAGARHSFETYLLAERVRPLDPGVYRYLPLEHALVHEFSEAGLPERLAAACFGQDFVAAAAVTFVWTTLPYRTEWRYGPAAHKVIALDAGHVAQNLYLACEAIHAGTCAIAAYDQEAMDRLLRVDGRDEFTIYLAPVGKRRAGGDQAT